MDNNGSLHWLTIAISSSVGVTAKAIRSKEISQVVSPKLTQRLTFKAIGKIRIVNGGVSCSRNNLKLISHYCHGTRKLGKKKEEKGGGFERASSQVRQWQKKKKGEEGGEGGNTLSGRRE